MPVRNAFDFVERPQAEMQDTAACIVGGNNSHKGIDKLKSVMLGLKKKNRTNYTNKRMALVKIDS